MAQTNVQAFSGDVAISSNLAVDTNTLFVDSVGNNVGIGKTNPGSALDVVGDVAISGDTILGTATYRKRRDWNRNALAYVYLGNIRTMNTTGIRLDVSINNANSGYQMFNFQINLNGADAAHSGGRLVYSVQGTANDSVLRAVEIGYVFLDDGTGLYTYQLWLKDPTTDVSGPMNAYLNCQGYYIFDTGVSDVAQGGAAPTNFNVGVVGILVDNIGNVGIGTNAPDSRLHIEEPTSIGATTTLFHTETGFAGGSRGHFEIKEEKHGAGTGWSDFNLRLQRRVDSVVQGYMDFNPSGTGGDYGIAFGNSGGGGPGEIMRIGGLTGNVGIGKTNPGTALDVVGTVTATSYEGSGANLTGISAGGYNSAVDTIKIGNGAGTTGQGANSVAVGHDAGSTGQGAYAAAVGNGAGQTSQGVNATAVGYRAGQTSQGANATAVGDRAGNTSQGAKSTAVGYLAGSTGQGAEALAVGYLAGQTGQGSTPPPWESMRVRPVREPKPSP